MYAPIQVATLAASLLHPLPAVADQQLRPQPITVSGVACATPHDMAGLYKINIQAKPSTADDLLGKGSAAGLRCEILRNVSVVSWGQVGGDDGVIPIGGGKSVPIYEVVEPSGVTPHHHLYLVAKTK